MTEQPEQPAPDQPPQDPPQEQHPDAVFDPETFGWYACTDQEACAHDRHIVAPTDGVVWGTNLLMPQGQVMIAVPPGGQVAVDGSEGDGMVALDVPVTFSVVAPSIQQVHKVFQTLVVHANGAGSIQQLVDGLYGPTGVTFLRLTVPDLLHADQGQEVPD